MLLSCIVLAIRLKEHPKYVFPILRNPQLHSPQFWTRRLYEHNLWEVIPTHPTVQTKSKTQHTLTAISQSHLLNFLHPHLITHICCEGFVYAFINVCVYVYGYVWIIPLLLTNFPLLWYFFKREREMMWECQINKYVQERNYL